MNTPGFASRSLAGGYDLDPDLPVPEPSFGGIPAGLHALRHLQRFVESLGLELVLTGDEYSELWCYLARDYDESVEEAEFRRYRRAATPAGIRKILRDEPRAMPLFGMDGSSCTGWSTITWDGVRLDRYLQPGRLFALLPRMAVMSPRGQRPGHLHLMAWQPPFPTYSLVTWSSEGQLCDGPQELDDHVRRAAGWMFHRC